MLIQCASSAIIENMKLIIVLSLIACGYAAKLDRTYLPPSSAATAGGSPGALTAPGSNTGFGQGLSNISAGPTGSRPSSFGQNSGVSNVPSVTGNIQGSGLGQASGSFPETTSLGLNSNIGTPSQNEIQNTKTDTPSGPSFGQGFNDFGSNPQYSRTHFGQTPQSNGQAFAQGEFKPERAQAAADRNAEILKYVNENNGDSYEYSYETSNGIVAGESGVATNGVRAQGGYSYTGDDGKSYSVTYTADENGYQPQGEHLPTPPPIPEEILKSIEDNARAAASGTQEGAYRPEEYESESSPQQYSTGESNYNQPQRPITSLLGQGFSPSSQGQNQPDLPTQSSFIVNPFNQRKPGQVASKFSGARTQQEPQNLFPQGLGSTNKDSYPESLSQPKQSQKSFQGSNNLVGTLPGQSNQILQGQNGQGTSGNGYNYNRPSTQGTNQLQEGPIQKMSQGFGNINNGLSGQQAGQPTTQFNQPQRPLQGFKNQFDNQRGPSNQNTPGQSGQGQNGNGYNYNRSQNPTQSSNQFSGQKTQQGQPQNFSPSFGSNNKGLSDQSTRQSIGQINQQQRPFQNSKDQFDNQQGPQQYSQGQNSQNQRENGYNYNQPQNTTQGPSFPGSGSQQSTSNGVFRQQPGQPTPVSQPQRPLQSSSNVFGKQQEQSNQNSQGQIGQDQNGNGYNYNQPQKLSQGSNQFPGFGNKPGKSMQPGQGTGINNKVTPSGAQAGQSNNQYGQPQRPLQGFPSSGLGNQQGQSNHYSPNQKGQDQDENGYYYNRPQNSVSSPTAQGPFGLNSPQSSAPSQSSFSASPASIYDSNDNSKNQGLRPGQHIFSNMNQPSFAQTRPEVTNVGNINGPETPSQGTQYSSEVNKPSFGSPSTNYRPGNEENSDLSRPNERYQPNLAPASKFPTQQSTGQNKPASLSFGSPSTSQNSPGQTLAQGYQYSGPGLSSNQSQRPGFNVSGNQVFNGAPGANKGPAGSEFGGPRQPPSFSPEEGYKY